MYNILAKVIKVGLMLTFYGQNRSKFMSFDTTIQTWITSFFRLTDAQLFTCTSELHHKEDLLFRLSVEIKWRTGQLFGKGNINQNYWEKL